MSKHQSWIFHLLLLTSITCTGQRITYNHIVDHTDSDTREVMDLFEAYMTSEPSKRAKSIWWNSEEQNNFEHFDFLEDEFSPSLYMGLPVHVLSLSFRDKKCYIKAQFSYLKDDASPYVLAIVNYMAIKENGKYKLANILSENKREWTCTSLGIVDFYCPPYHKFNKENANKLLDFIQSISTNFGIQASPFEYYLANDYDEIQKLKGIDYYIGMGGYTSPKGKASSDKVYCGGLGEYYPHEVFHVQIDKHFPDQHFWVSEGIATLLGGSRGKELEWHLKRTNEYLESNPQINLNNLLDLRNLDEVTAYHYALGGLIAKKVFEKGGYELLMEFMESGKSDEDYYNAIESILEVKRSKLNHYLRTQLSLECK